MENSFIQLRVIYEDLPDLIELGVSVQYCGWSAFSKAYTSPSKFSDEAQQLLKWASLPTATVQIEAGADTGIGWMVLKFYTIDAAGHVRCAVKLATGKQSYGARLEETWRFAIEMETELGLIEQFARECIALSTDFTREARLSGLPHNHL